MAAVIPRHGNTQNIQRRGVQDYYNSAALHENLDERNIGGYYNAAMLHDYEYIDEEEEDAQEEAIEMNTIPRYMPIYDIPCELGYTKSTITTRCILVTVSMILVVITALLVVVLMVTGGKKYFLYIHLWLLKSHNIMSMRN